MNKLFCTVLSAVFIVGILRRCICQRTERIERAVGDDSCKTVNVYFGDEKKSVTNRATITGAPGKRGAIGPVGPQGPKGSQGPKGEPGKSNEMKQRSANVARILGAKSCEELNTVFDVKESGYYLLKANSLAADAPVYRYCNFKTYNLGSCAELVKSYGIKKYGYYRLRSKSGGYSYQFCPDVYTCHHLSQRDGITQSGLYNLGPPNSAFQVYCNLFSGTAVTEVFHDSINEDAVKSTCQGRGCYSRIPKYKINDADILKIVENSRQCRQFIKMRCQASVLFFNSDTYAWWVSRGGEKMLYWGGAVSKQKNYCACGETGTCVDNKYKCNCDNNREDVMTQDEGYLTDKTKLPVKEIKMGDVDGAKEFAWHQLGALECTGEESE